MPPLKVVVLDFPTLPATLQTGELSISSIVLPADDAYLNTATPLSAAITTSNHLIGLQVRFEVIQNGLTVFEERVLVSELITGTNYIETAGTWSPASSGAFDVRVTVDSNGAVNESNEGNNVLQTQGNVLAQNGLTISATTLGGEQWIASTSIDLTLSSNLPLDSGLVQLYRYVGQQGDLSMQTLLHVVDSPLDVSDLNDVAFELAAASPAGTYVAYIWGWSGSQRSNYQRVVFNYAPANYHQTIDELFYRHQATTGQPLTFDLALLSGSVIWYVWSPNTPNTAQMYVGGGVYTVNSAVGGEYVLMVVRDSADATYTLTQQNSVSRQATRQLWETVQMNRPMRVDNVVTLPDQPTVPTAITLTQLTAEPTVWLPFISALLLMVVSMSVHLRTRQR